jgi:hypothetical protein
MYGEGAGLPLVNQKDLYKFAKLSDLVVVDGSFPVVRTRRSWRPHQDALFFDELRRQYGITTLGPTPTIDLLSGDRRYLRKWCGKLGIAYDTDRDTGVASGLPEVGGIAEGAGRGSRETWFTGGWFRDKDIIPPGPYLQSWAPLFKSVGFRGYFQLDGYISESGPVVTSATASWPVADIPADHEVEFLTRMAS